MDLPAIPGEFGTMPRRMFAAIDLPARITATLAGLDPHVPGLRWLPPSMQHLTLCFLAAVPEENESRLIESLAAIVMPPFSIELKGLGCFGRRRHPSVVWVGVANTPPELYQLQSRVREAVLAAGLETDEKPFHPHITVGRCKMVSGKALKPLFELHGDREFGFFDATGFTLYSSVLKPSGPEYEPVFRRNVEPS